MAIKYYIETTESAVNGYVQNEETGFKTKLLTSAEGMCYLDTEEVSGDEVEQEEFFAWLQTVTDTINELCRVGRHPVKKPGTHA